MCKFKPPRFVQDSTMGDASVVDQESIGKEEDHSQPPDDANNTDHSKKKHRKDLGSFSGTESRVPRDEEWMHNIPNEQEGIESKMSYRDSVRKSTRAIDFDKEVVNTNQEQQNQEEEDSESEASSEEDNDGQEEEGNGIEVEKDVFDRINFTLSDKEWRRLNKPFRRKSLIIKVLGKTVRFKFLLKKVNQLWGRTGEVELVDLARKIEYEGLHFICFECGVYGHDLEHSPIYLARKEKEKLDKEKNGQPIGDQVEAKTKTGKEHSQYGPWMTVTKSIRIRRQGPLAQNQKIKKDKGNQGIGFRFAILGSDDHDGKEKEPEKHQEISGPDPKKMD
ncbi:hypothetical protein G2W53_004630 [Senna tora]|uniref:Uncharacterized protein n=1 Tax=Senna tora TaxID=362788 RepID=A0A834XDP6_9FABA|nr:hypothetical protein G2W53_004630 [Senna tora]